MSTLRLTTISNQSGSATVPSETVISGSAKAWVNFNGTGTVAIRAGFNVSSITDVNTGQYRVNFTTNMPDANYCTVISATNNIGTSAGFSSFDSNNQSVSQTNLIFIADPSTSVTYDAAVVNVVVFR
jgi:hypothetical protein